MNNILETTLRSNHRQSALNAVTAKPYGEWGSKELKDQFDAATKSMARNHLAVDWSTIDFEGGSPTPNMSKPKTVHAIPLLGRAGISLIYQSTGMALELPESHDLYNTTCKLIDSPVRELGVNLHTAPLSSETTMHFNSSEEQARILLCPDLPPLAIHCDDLNYSAKSHGIDGLNYVRLISAVSRDFGPESIEYLSDATQENISSAIQISRAAINVV